MKPKLLKDLGMRYPTEKSSRKYRYGLYECQYCNKEFEAQSNNIKNGQTKSCGCQRKGINITHGMHSNKFYNTWYQIVRRCTNPKDNAYKDYGGRGIAICEEWLDVATFIAWCEYTYIEGMTIDRIDNDKGYSPENCRWVGKATQKINQRMQKNNKSGYVGVTWHIRNKKWGAYISVNKISKQIGSFLTIEEAVLARDNYIIENKLPHKLSILNTGI